MKKIILLNLLSLLLVSCEHSGQTITEFSGDYRHYAGISEFYDCKEHIKYYVSDSGISTDLQSMYLKLNMKDKDDVYIKVKGYLKEEKQIEGIDPKTVFVAVKLISHDENRGCDRAIREGN